MSRTEGAFLLRYAEEHPSEVLDAIEDQTEGSAPREMKRSADVKLAPPRGPDVVLLKAPTSDCPDRSKRQRSILLRSVASNLFAKFDASRQYTRCVSDINTIAILVKPMLDALANLPRIMEEHDAC